MVQMIILGIVQGLTEFLPVSSSAHLVFTEHFLGIPRPGVVLEAVLHLGTALAATVLFWPDVVRLLRAFFRPAARPPGGGRDRASPDPYRRLAWLIVLITAMTGAVGLLFADDFERMFRSVRGTAGQLIVTGVILVLARERGRRRLADTAVLDAGAVGIAQAVSIVPGISRSGITIAAAMWTGMARDEAARLSFLAAIPAIVGAGLFALRDLGAAAQLGYTASQLLVGFTVSALFGAVAIRGLLDVLRRGRLMGFAVYCWVVGLGVFLSTFR
jgi:undecaprenyl-diphosphatase